jgi:hypothetical protein
MDALHYLDVVIGFSLRMMVLATLVGTATAIWLSVARSRVRNLESGLQLVVGTIGHTLAITDLQKAVKVAPNALAKRDAAPECGYQPAISSSADRTTYPSARSRLAKV